ncbi:hypothetical protein CUMW_256180 [Citrus unshiu]|uniref:Uncharacterized protein n=1 Tax=Citrus unshiu TaxID=55188 RepID=A0A2H5QS23_CITUN|nr:hypothetical protein CUMW_256180 [Citrus unshiu]
MQRCIIFTNQKLEANQDLRRKKIKGLLAYILAKAAFNTSLNLLSNTIFSIDLVDPNEREFKEYSLGYHGRSRKPNLSDHFPLLKMLDRKG